VYVSTRTIDFKLIMLISPFQYYPEPLFSSMGHSCFIIDPSLLKPDNFTNHFSLDCANLWYSLIFVPEDRYLAMCAFHYDFAFWKIADSEAKIYTEITDLILQSIKTFSFSDSQLRHLRESDIYRAEIACLYLFTLKHNLTKV
jgi:hypothetical protein